MMENVKSVGKVLACVVLFLVLYFLIGFSFDRSSLLAVMLFALLFWRAFKPPHFEPYRVSIEPNWYPLLLDHGLIKDLEEWQRIVAKRDSQIPASEYNVSRDGISFTVLNDVIYRDDRKKFSKHVDFIEPLPELSLLHPGGWYYHPDVSIGFTTIKAAGAYKICVTAPDSVKHLERDENSRVVVALLPWAEFDIYREDRGDVNHLIKLAAKVDKQMHAQGWTRRQEPESYYDPPCTIEHKYFTVQHKRI